MPASLQDAITWMIGAIQADSQVQALGVTEAFMYSAPERGTIVSYPFVIIGKSAGAHKNVMCGPSFDHHYLAVKCVDTSFDGGERARKVLHRVRQVIEFGRPAVSVSSGKIDSILPNSSYEYDEQESGNNNFFHAVQVERVVLS